MAPPESSLIGSAPGQRVLEGSERTVGVLACKQSALDQDREHVGLRHRHTELMTYLRRYLQHRKVSSVPTSYRRRSYLGVPLTGSIEYLTDVVMLVSVSDEVAGDASTQQPIVLSQERLHVLAELPTLHRVDTQRLAPEAQHTGSGARVLAEGGGSPLARADEDGTPANRPTRTVRVPSASALALAEVIDNVTDHTWMARSLSLIEDKWQAMKVSGSPLDPNLGGIPGIHSCGIVVSGSAPH